MTTQEQNCGPLGRYMYRGMVWVRTLPSPNPAAAAPIFHVSERARGQAKEEFNKIQLELADLSTRFSNNVLDATKAFSVTLHDMGDVEGLPASALALAAQSAKVGAIGPR